MYKIELCAKARKTYIKLPIGFRALIYEKLSRVAISPYSSHSNIERLKGEKDYYRLRIGDWRVIYKLSDDAQIIEIIDIGHRREVYR